MDSELIRKTLSGDVDAFGQLINNYEKRLYNFIFKMCLSREDTEEILQEAFIKIYKNLYKYNDKYSFSTWAYTIALNTFKSEAKKNRRFKFFELDDKYVDLLNIKSPEEAFIDKEELLGALERINALKVDHRAVLILKYIDELSYKEIGDILKVSPDAAKMKVHRAKQILCKQRKSVFGGEINEK